MQSFFCVSEKKKNRREKRVSLCYFFSVLMYNWENYEMALKSVKEPSLCYIIFFTTVICCVCIMIFMIVSRSDVRVPNHPEPSGSSKHRNWDHCAAWVSSWQCRVGAKILHHCPAPFRRSLCNSLWRQGTKLCELGEKMDKFYLFWECLKSGVTANS